MVTNACRILRFPRRQQRCMLSLELSELLLERHPEAQRERPLLQKCQIVFAAERVFLEWNVHMRIDVGTFLGHN